MVWNVPIVMKIDGKEIPILLDERENEFEIEAIKTSKYVHLNANSKGFYATQYDAQMLNDLLANLNELTPIDKLMLIRELSALSKSGYTEDATERLLDLILASKQETSATVWDALLTAASEMNKLIDNDKEMQPEFDRIMVDTVTPIYEALNKWGDDDTEDQKKDMERADVLRPMVLSVMAKHGNKEVIDACTAKFDSFVMDQKHDDEKSNIPDALRRLVYVNGVKYGDKSRYNALKQYTLATKDDIDRERALNCLGYTRDPQLIEQTLYWVKDSDEVRKQDKAFALTSCSSTSMGRDICWKFLLQTVTEWKDLYGMCFRFCFESRTLPRFVEHWTVMKDGSTLFRRLFSLPSGFVDAAKADEVETFYGTLVNGYEACQKAMDQCVESIRSNARWKKSAIKSIGQWINKNSKK